MVKGHFDTNFTKEFQQMKNREAME